MDAITKQKLHIKVTEIENMVTIFLGGYFSFGVHREFKAAYINQLSNSKINSIVVDLAEVNYLDSSALGMLLLMREHVLAANKSLVLSRPSSFATRIFDIASFNKMFTIN